MSTEKKPGWQSLLERRIAASRWAALVTKDSDGATILPSLEIELMEIPEGTFLMGSPEDEIEHRKSESPQHVVTFKPFFMGKYPITQAQWQVVSAMPQVNRELDPDPSRFKGKNRPVERVYWYDAVEFCDRLCVYTKRQYRLPSEAEWEYACRAGTTTPFHFGETMP
ncbi:MAG: formylglycine-generating enzyme family protein [Scytonema sp. PMC 1069.18]|nr:formylglycine-generating enzyme family protein [Scytonema sp. PMC 1069.18]MEC4885362.1 formylglycine-generating enzyme family protein [Scytonema sp. PMC 1070.18]